MLLDRGNISIVSVRPDPSVTGGRGRGKVGGWKSTSGEGANSGRGWWGSSRLLVGSSGTRRSRFVTASVATRPSGGCMLSRTRSSGLKARTRVCATSGRCSGCDVLDGSGDRGELDGGPHAIKSRHAFKQLVAEERLSNRGCTMPSMSCAYPLGLLLEAVDGRRPGAGAAVTVVGPIVDDCRQTPG